MELDTIIQSDALDFLRSLPDDSVDMGLTSPPYDNLRTYNGYTWNFEGIAQESYRVLKPGGVLVWIIGDMVMDGSETLTGFKQALYFKEVCGFNVHDTMIYEKDGSPFPESNRYWQEFEYMFVLSKGKPDTANLLTTSTKWKESRKIIKHATRNQDGTLSDKKYEMGKPTKPFSNIWRFVSGYMKTTKDVEAYKHPAMFPEALAERHILTWSNPGDIVMDFFMGSGTTAKMAIKNDRHYIGCDISAEYVTLARQRIQSADPFQPTQVDVDTVQLSLFDGEQTET
jgi:DNA modification methylase